MAQDFGEGIARKHLYECLRSSGMAHLATLMVRLQVASLDDLVLRRDELLHAGAHTWQLDRVLTCEAAAPVSKVEESDRADLPIHRTLVGRASLTAALLVRVFEQDILAQSANPTQDSRIRTYRTICKTWDVEPFPITLESIRCFGASLKAGGYRSAALYYQAILGHQARHLHIVVEPLLRSAIKDAVRSIKRGLGPAGLEDSFNAMDLTKVVPGSALEPFDISNPVHMFDVVVLGLWFMLREAEL